jgi:hypothetical protein
MADELYSKLILLGVFCGISAFLFMAISPIIQSNAMMNDPTSYQNTIDLPGESFYSPNPFAVTNASVKSHYEFGHESATFTSPVAHRHDILTWVVRNNSYLGSIQPRYNWLNDYRDCILFEMNYGMWNTKHKHVALSYETIGANFDIKTNVSKVDFSLNADLTLFVSTGPGYAFPVALYANEYNMSIGWMWNMSDAVDPSPWSLVGQILTFSIPDIGSTLNLIIGIPVYLTLGFLILAVVSRFFPTVPGL